MLGKEAVVSQTYLREIRRRSFEYHAQKRDRRGYGVERGLFEYIELLPTFEGKNFVEHIEEKFEKNGLPLDVLDVGCGKGFMLGELTDQDYYPPVRLYGVSSFDYYQFLGDEKNMVDPDDEMVYGVGDMQRLHKVFPDIQFDIVVAVQAVQWSADSLASLKEMYRVCKPEGMLFVDYVRVPLTEDQLKLLKTFWERQGIPVEFQRFPLVKPPPYNKDSSYYGIAMQKRKNPRLIMPFRYAGLKGGINADGVIETFFEYAFDEKIAQTA